MVFFLSQQFTDNIREAWNEKFKAIDEIIKRDNRVDSDEKRDLIETIAGHAKHAHNVITLPLNKGLNGINWFPLSGRGI